MTNNTGFVQPFKLRTHQDGVRRKDSFSDSGEGHRRKQVTVSRKAYLQATNCVGTREKCKGESLMPLAITHILPRSPRNRGTRGTPVPNLCDIVQAETAGGDQARRRRTYSMNR